LSRTAWQPTFRASPRQKSVRRQIDEVRPGIGEFDFKAGGKVPRMIRLGVWRAGGSDSLDEVTSERPFETVSIEAKASVDVVLEKSMPSVSRRKVSKSEVSQNISSSAENDNTGQGSAFEKPCGSDATSSVEENDAASMVAGVGVLGGEMLSQFMSTSASSSSHTLQDRNKPVSHVSLRTSQLFIPLWS
jgi:hypothetical protein